jgi:hypothetical protein
MLNFIKKILNWIVLLLSDSKFASTRRFIGVLSFFNLMLIGALATLWKTKFLNGDLIAQLASYFFTMSIATIVGTTLTDIAGTIKASQLNSKETTDPFNISKDGDNYR